MNGLSSKERKYWAWALANPPIRRDFDTVQSSQVVLALQEKTKKLYANGATPSAREESQLWTHVGQLVRQLQEARSIIRRLGPEDKPDHEPKWKPKDIAELRIEENPCRMFHLGSPTVAPPSPIRSNQVSFCANDIKAALDAMRRHKTHPKIQEQGCRALLELMRQGRKRRTADGKKPKKGSWACSSCKFCNEKEEKNCRICALPRGDALEIEDSETTREEDEALHKTECERIKDAGGIAVLVDAMRNFPTHDKVLRAACFAMAQMTQEKPEIISEVAAAGGIKELLNILKRMDQDSEVQAQCLGILASPEMTNDNVVRIEEDEFARVVCHSIRQHKGAKRLQALGCLALSNLALKSDRSTMILVQDPDYSCHRLILDILQLSENKKNPHLVASCLWALLVLCRDLRDGSEMLIRETLKECGTVQLAIELMATHPTNQSIQSNSRKLFERLGVTIDGYDHDLTDKDSCMIS